MPQQGGGQPKALLHPQRKMFDFFVLLLFQADDPQYAVNARFRDIF